MVSSEAFPLVKTGGLADVCGALARTLAERGHDVRLMLPAYRGVPRLANAEPALSLGDPLGTGPTALLRGRLPDTDVEVWLVDNPGLFDRPGGPYLDATGSDWPDNDQRFALLGRAAAIVAIAGNALGWSPQVVHAHDWQAGLVPAHLAWWGGQHPPTVFTVHNLHFAGRFAPKALPALGLPPQAFSMYGLELYGSISFLKAGLYYADRLTTVSPRYAEEIQTPLGGEGLHGLLSARRAHLHGILNGIDRAQWNPRTDPHLVARYGTEDLSTKAENKSALQAELGLNADPAAALLGLVGRLTWQKGIDLVLEALPFVLRRGGQLAVLGSGEAALEAALREAATRFPGRVAFRQGYDEPLSHRMIAGSDIFLVPSRFEPCGLTQMYAMSYGTPPLVRRTGGLADTVHDARADLEGEGFVFVDPSTPALVATLERALDAFADGQRWRGIQRCGMRRDFGWDHSAARYEALYDDVAAERSTRPSGSGKT